MDTDDHVRSAALAAAERGWHVFPLRPNGKAPALHGADRCPGTGPCVDGHQGWEQRATTDPARIRSAWSTGQPFNIGLATGPSGLCVLDLDTAKPDEQPPTELADYGGIASGEDVLAVVAAEAGEPVPADTFTVATPSGGWHLYFRAPQGVQLRNTSGERGQGLGWKVDTRAWGGYVVAPGSVIDGRTYRPLADGPATALPDWLTRRLLPAPPPEAPVVPIQPRRGTRARYIEAAIRAETAKVHAATGGQRNAALYGAAVALGQLVAGGALTTEDHTSALMDMAAKHIAVRAYSERQARQTIASGLRAGANRPRQVA